MVRWQMPVASRTTVHSWSSLCRILLSQTFSGNSRIVFAVVNDPVEQGFILSMAHPAGNVTGFSFIDFPFREVASAA